MKTFTIFAFGCLFALNAFAEITVDCNTPESLSPVSMFDTPHGFGIVDEGNPLVDRREDLQPSEESAFSLTFLVDVGTSEKVSYEFSGLRECYDDGFSRTVQLTMFAQAPGGAKRALSTMTCDCSSD